MASKKPSLAVELDETGRPVRPTPDSRKVAPRPLGRRLLPQVPPSGPRIRKTVVPR
jgi:hypothetical protein